MDTSPRPLTAVVLAAGQGTRMRSVRPKPLHTVAGRSMVGHVLRALEMVQPARIVVVVGHGGDEMRAELPATIDGAPVLAVDQPEQRGTGDAVRIALAAIEATGEPVGDVVVLPGDTPLLRSISVKGLLDAHRSGGASATALTARVADPTGYGRIVRDSAGAVTGVVEHADASEAQRRIDEINTSIYSFDGVALEGALARINPDNAQGEWYLTDVIGVLHGDGARVGAWILDDPAEAQGVNDRVQLAATEMVLRRRINEAWMREGVTMIDPATTQVDVDVTLARDVVLSGGVVLGGATVIGEGVVVGPHVSMTDAVVGAGAVIGAGAVLDPGAVVSAGDVVAPLVRLGASAGRLPATQRSL